MWVEGGQGTLARMCSADRDSELCQIRGFSSCTGGACAKERHPCPRDCVQDTRVPPLGPTASRTEGKILPIPRR